VRRVAWSEISACRAISISSAGLSAGMSVYALIEFDRASGVMIFEKEVLLKCFWNKFKSDSLKQKLQRVLGADTTLDSDALKALLLVVMRNVTTGSPRPLINNPHAENNVCNLGLLLRQLVRASTAAPTFFSPEVEEIHSREFVIVDGGMTPSIFQRS
jgi:uncharacterized protein